MAQLHWKTFIQPFLDNDNQVIQIIRDYEQFVKDGMIGDCLLRSIANCWCVNINSSHVVLTMDAVARECYRILALRWIEAKDLTR